jgi:hypothetical protein
LSLTAGQWHLKEVEVVRVGSGASWLFVCGQWLSQSKGCSLVHGDDTAKTRVGLLLENVEKPDAPYPATTKSASIRLCVANLQNISPEFQMLVVVSVLSSDRDDSEKRWTEVSRTESLSCSQDLFYPALRTMQYDPPSALLPHGTQSLLNIVLVLNGKFFGSVEVVLEEIFAHVSSRTGIPVTNYADVYCNAAAMLSPQVSNHLHPVIHFTGTRDIVTVPKTVTFLNLRMLALNLPPRVHAAQVYASVSPVIDSQHGDHHHSFQTNHCASDVEPFWDALQLQIDPPNRIFPSGPDTKLQVTIIENSTEFGRQSFGQVVFCIKDALFLASVRRGIPLEPCGALDCNLVKLLEPKIFFHGSHKSFAVFDPALHSVLEPPRAALVPRRPSLPMHSSTASMRIMSRARIIRDFEQRLTFKESAKCAQEDAHKAARAAIVISRFFAKIMYEARKKVGPGATLLSVFRSRKYRAAVSIQSAWRARSARAAVSLRLNANKVNSYMKRFACVRLQCAYRAHRARRLAQKMQSLQRSFRVASLAVRVQARFRGNLGRFRAQQLRRERHHRLKLQMFVRRWLLNRRIQSKRRNSAASRIQRNVLVLLGTNNFLRYDIAQRHYAWQGFFMVLWAVIIGLLSFLTMKSAAPLQPFYVRSSDILAFESAQAAPARSYLMFDWFLSHMRPLLLHSRRNSSVAIKGSPYWETRSGGVYNRMFLPAASVFVPVDAVSFRLRRRMLSSNPFFSDVLLSFAGNASAPIFTSSINRSDMRELALHCPWSDTAGPIVGCPTCSLYLPPDGNVYAYSVTSDPTALSTLLAQGWDVAGASSVALDIPFFSALHPVVSIMTVIVQTPDNTAGTGLSFLTTRWQSRSLSSASWFYPSPHPPAVALAVMMGLVVFLHACDILLSHEEWLFRRNIST